MHSPDIERKFNTSEGGVLVLSFCPAFYALTSYMTGKRLELEGQALSL